MACAQKCGNCAGCGMSGYTKAPPLAFAGWRLRLGGNPPGGQYHGYLGAESRDAFGTSPWDFFSPGHTAADGVYRSPGETPPSANPNRETNTVVVPHARQRVGYAVVPGAFSTLGIMFDPCAQVPAQFRSGCNTPPYEIPTGPAVVPAPRSISSGPVVAAPIAIQAPAPKPISNIRFPIYSGSELSPIVITGSTQRVLQPPPVDVPQPSPVIDNAPPPPGMYRDAAGNLTSDWHNPYSLHLPESIQPAPIVAADTSLTPGAGQTTTSIASGPVAGNAVSTSPSWLTDPNQELISGIPNWGIVAVALGAFLLMKGRR